MVGLIAKKNLERVLAQNSSNQTRRQEFLLRLLINFRESREKEKERAYDSEFILSSAYVMQRMKFIPTIWTDFDNRSDIYDGTLHGIDLETLEQDRFIVNLSGDYHLKADVSNEYFKENPGQGEKTPPEFIKILEKAKPDSIRRLAQILCYAAHYAGDRKVTSISPKRLGGAKNAYGISGSEYNAAFSLYRKLKTLDPRKQILL